MTVDKELLEYLENMTEQEQEIIKNNRPVLSYFTKAEGSTVIDSVSVIHLTLTTNMIV